MIVLRLFSPLYLSADCTLELPEYPFKNVGAQCAILDHLNKNIGGAGICPRG